MSKCRLHPFTPQTSQQALHAALSVSALLQTAFTRSCRRQFCQSFVRDSQTKFTVLSSVFYPGLLRRFSGTSSAQLFKLPLLRKPPRVTSHSAYDGTKARIPRLVSQGLSTSSQYRRVTIAPVPELPPDDITKIFGKEVEKDVAIEILSKLQEQRRQGTLDQTLDYEPELVEKALEYLRARYPVDEEAAIIARLDRELDGEWNLPQKNARKSRSARSGLQEIREMNKQKYEAKKALQEAQEKAEQEELEQRQTTEGQGGADTQLVSRKQTQVVRDDGMVRRPGVRPMPEWMARYYDNATARTIPQMSKAQRLIPSALFTAGAVGIAILFAYAYSPPAADARLFPGIPPAAAAVGAIVALNCLIFVLWKVPQLWKFMNSNFMVVPAVPRAFSMLGAEFSHQEFGHLLTNMIGFWFIGTWLHDDIGRGPFFALVTCGAVIPSFCALTAYVVRSVFITATVGASGIVCAILGASCYLHEGQQIQLPLLGPEISSGINTGVVLAIFMAVEALSLLRKGLAPTELINSGKQNIDRLGHLAGYGVGISAGYVICNNDPYWKNVKRESFWRTKKGASSEP